MDPTTTLSNLLSSLAGKDPDREYILQCLHDLESWIGRSGFLPQVNLGATEPFFIVNRRTIQKHYG